MKHTVIVFFLLSASLVVLSTNNKNTCLKSCAASKVADTAPGKVVGNTNVGGQPGLNDGYNLLLPITKHFILL